MADKATTGFRPSPDAIPFLPALSTPRPNGSPALERTVQEVQAWLEEEGIPVHRHRFTFRPYPMELLGLWMALTGVLLPVAALARWAGLDWRWPSSPRWFRCSRYAPSVPLSAPWCSSRPTT